MMLQARCMCYQCNLHPDCTARRGFRECTKSSSQSPPLDQVYKAPPPPSEPYVQLSSHMAQAVCKIENHPSSSGPPFGVSISESSNYSISLGCTSVSVSEALLAICLSYATVKFKRSCRRYGRPKSGKTRLNGDTDDPCLGELQMGIPS